MAKANSLHSPPRTTNGTTKGTKTLGVTSALNLDFPSPTELKATQEMIDAMRPHKVFDTTEGCRHRVKILVELEKMTKEWIREMTLAQGRSEEYAKEVGGKIYTFGSYRLGVHTQGADIDALLVAPRNISREDVFTKFADRLRGHDHIKHVKVIEDAYVPVIKMVFSGIEMDLTYARLALKTVPNNLNLQDTELLRNLDQRCIRSLNGCRVTDAILSLVPDVDNKEAFKCALRMIKLWARNRGIYSNAMGYLGGVSWAILVARICQLYPNACASTVVHKFFRVFNKWVWPNPIMLKVFDENVLNMQVWDPRLNEQDSLHKMPIITPAYPQQNTTFNVRKSSLSVMQEELERALKLSILISMNKCEWEVLFEPVHFYHKYKHYIIVEVMTETEQDLLEWQGLLESRIRFLIEKMEAYPIIDVACVYTHPVTTQEENPSKSPDASKLVLKSSYFVGLKFHKVDKIDLQLEEPIKQFIDRVKDNARKNKFSLTPNITAFYFKRVQLKDKYPNIDLKRKDTFSRLMKQYIDLMKPYSEFFPAHSSQGPHGKSPSPPNSNPRSFNPASPALKDAGQAAGASPKSNGASPRLDVSMQEVVELTDVESAGNSQMDTSGGSSQAREGGKRKNDSSNISEPKRSRSQSPVHEEDHLLTPELSTPYEFDKKPLQFSQEKKEIEIKLILKGATTAKS